jgi:hypothetical protein
MVGEADRAEIAQRRRKGALDAAVVIGIIEREERIQPGGIDATDRTNKCVRSQRRRARAGRASERQSPVAGSAAATRSAAALIMYGSIRQWTCLGG